MPFSIEEDSRHALNCLLIRLIKAIHGAGWKVQYFISPLAPAVVLTSLSFKNCIIASLFSVNLQRSPWEPNKLPNFFFMFFVCDYYFGGILTGHTDKIHSFLRFLLYGAINFCIQTADSVDKTVRKMLWATACNLFITKRECVLLCYQ